MSLKISRLKTGFLITHVPGSPHFYVRCEKSETEAGTGKSREAFWKEGANYKIWGFRKPAKRRSSGVGARLWYAHSGMTQTAAKLHIFGWLVGLIANLQLCCENIFKSNELLWKRFLLIVLAVEKLCFSLIQKPPSFLWIYAHLCLYLSIYERPRKEFDKKISESVEDLLAMLWNCPALSKLLVRRLGFSPIFKQLDWNKYGLIFTLAVLCAQRWSLMHTQDSN